MPTVKLLSLKITAEVAVKKFFLREMLYFFIEQRNKILGDSDFTFTAQDFSEYIKRKEFSTTLGIYISNNTIEENLNLIKSDFLKRDKNIKIKEPREPLLTFGIEGPRDNRIFKIMDCQTDYINNTLRYLDISLMLIDNTEDKERIDDLELQRKIESINDESLFGQTQDHRLIFCNKPSDRALGLKERAIFNILKNNFKTEVSANNIYEAILALTQRTTTTRGAERNGFVNDGVIELRKKLCEISGNPETIITASGRVSTYKLVY